MGVSRLTIVAALAFVATLVVGSSVVAAGRVLDQNTHHDRVAVLSTDNDEPKKKDEPKEKKDADEGPPQAFLGIRYNGDQEEGPPSVEGVIEDSPAAKAGIKEGDTILKIGDKEIKNLETLGKVLRTHKPGQVVTVKVKRDSKEMDIKVTLGKRPAEEP
jgi:S1-C subfamily serine protease